ASDEAIEAFLPEEYQLESGELGLRPTYSLREDGLFTFTRTVETERAFVGMEVVTLSAAAAKAKGVDGSIGARVKVVEGPARDSGIRPGDVLLKFAGQDVLSPAQYRALVRGSTPGAEVPIEFVHEGRKIDTKVKTESSTHIVRSSTYQRQLAVVDDMRRTGMRFVAIPRDVSAIVANLDQGGLMVSEVLPGGPGFFGDLRVGDLVYKIQGTPISNSSDYGSALEAAWAEDDSVTFLLRRGSGDDELNIRPVDDALDRDNVNLLGLFHYRSRPHSSRLSLIFGILFNFGRCYSIRGDEKDIHTNWGLALDLISYKGSKNRGRLKLLWILPISFGD
ncbi:MAG: PDZ domain-containing protein, partial [Planctomycetota bacterium]